MSAPDFSIKKRSRALVIAVLLLAVISLLGLGMIVRSGGSAAERICLYDDEVVVRFLAKRESHISFYFNMRRNADATKLYISPYDSDPAPKRLIIVSENRVESRSAPGRTAYLNRADEFVAWTDDFKQGVEFKDGYKLKLPEFALFDVDPSGEYFVIGEKPCSTWLGRVDSPQDRIRVSQELLAGKVFIRGGRIQICGWLFKGGPQSSEIQQIAACLIVRKQSDGYQIEKQVSFPWARGVVDADPNSNRLLLRGRSDLFARQHVYDIQTDTRRTIGWAKNRAFFLTHDLFGAKTTASRTKK